MNARQLTLLGLQSERSGLQFSCSGHAAIALSLDSRRDQRKRGIAAKKVGRHGGGGTATPHSPAHPLGEKFISFHHDGFIIWRRAINADFHDAMGPADPPANTARTVDAREACSDRMGTTVRHTQGTIEVSPEMMAPLPLAQSRSPSLAALLHHGPRHSRHFRL